VVCGHPMVTVGTGLPIVTLMPGTRIVHLPQPAYRAIRVLQLSPNCAHGVAFRLNPPTCARLLRVAKAPDGRPVAIAIVPRCSYSVEIDGHLAAQGTAWSRR
jgi:hypothetical protein